VDDTDRLSSYLDGALEPDELQALEAELAGDAALRAELEALRQVDAWLQADLAVELPPGARQRLDERLGPVLRAAVTEGTPPAAAAAPTPSPAQVRHDELAGRRARRRLPVAIGGVAAGLAVLAIGVVGIDRLLGPMGGEDESATMALDRESSEDRAELAEAMPEPEPPMPELAGLPELPIVVDDGRRVSGQDLQDLPPDTSVLAQLTAAAIDGVQAERLAASAETRLFDGPPATDDRDESAGDGTGADAESAPPGPALTASDGRALSAEDTTAVRRCTAELPENPTVTIPVRIELLEVDGEPALEVGRVTADPATGAYTQVEVWTLERSSCQVLRVVRS